MAMRKAMFAGTWYPAEAHRCERQIQEFLLETPSSIAGAPPFVAGIVPHAGWHFSGAVACRVIELLARQTVPDVLFLFGMHLPAHANPRMMVDGSWETPFGDLPVAAQVADALRGRFSFRIETAQDFTPDNTLELQLPFVRYFFERIPIVPIGVPANPSAVEIGRAAVELANELGFAVKVIGSTDLTHYGANYGYMPQGPADAAVQWVREENDRRIVEAMVAMATGKVLDEAAMHLNACCAGAAAATISAAHTMGATQGRRVAYTTSYDKHPGDSLVGYVGIVY